MVAASDVLSPGEVTPIRGASATTYRAEQRLGMSRRSETLLCTLLNPSGVARRCVVKRLREPLAHDEVARRRFVAYARQSGTLHHEHLVHAFDLDRDEHDRFFLATEYVDGKDLLGLMDTGPLPCPVAIFVAVGILSGLVYLQSRFPGLVHGEITPRQVLWSWHGSVKLVDVGFARALASPGTSPDVLGQSGYRAPEQVQGQAAGASTDLFVVGILLWEMLAGRRLFAASRPIETDAKILQAEHAPLRRHCRVQADIEKVVDKLLAVSPHRRYRSAQEAISALLHCEEAPRHGPDALSELLATRFHGAGSPEGR